MQLGPLLPPELAAGHELRHVLSAAFFLEFDEDGSGLVDRAEFRNNLWMLTRASKAEKINPSPNLYSSPNHNPLTLTLVPTLTVFAPLS